MVLCGPGKNIDEAFELVNRVMENPGNYPLPDEEMPNSSNGINNGAGRRVINSRWPQVEVGGEAAAREAETTQTGPITVTDDHGLNGRMRKYVHDATGDHPYFNGRQNWGG